MLCGDHRALLRLRQIPIEIAALPQPNSRDFVPGRFSDVGQRTRHRHHTDVRETCTEAGISRSAGPGGQADSRTGDGHGQGGEASPAGQGGDVGARPALAGVPATAGRLSIARSPPLPPTCRPPPIAEPSRHRASASRSSSRGGSCPACSQSRWCRPTTGAARAAGRDG